jgi:hypothetical protein
MNAPSYGGPFLLKSQISLGGPEDNSPASAGLPHSVSIKSKLSIPSTEGKMTPVQAFFAILKAYCVINILLLPKAFQNGGYILSPIVVVIACIFEGLCAIKLS